jgi:hypothetical protein
MKLLLTDFLSKGYTFQDLKRRFNIQFAQVKDSKFGQQGLNTYKSW